MSILQIENLSVSYGYVSALQGVSLSADKGQIVSIIGSNGAGKTTLLRTISGLVKPKEGSIIFEDRQLVKRKANKIVELGVVHVPEGRRCFSGLTVRDNLLVGGYLFSHKQLAENLERTYALFPRLCERERQFAGTLSGGEQQMLAIGRGMMSNPKILLLDEPSLGLAPTIISTVFELINKIRDSGVTIILVEQNAMKALKVCDKAYVIENGRIIMSNSGDELLNSPEVVSAYLGEKR